MADSENPSTLLDKQTISTPGYDSQVAATYKELEKAEFPARLWQRDPTLWKTEPAHRKIIENALGWLVVPEVMLERVADLAAFANEVRSAGFRDVMLLGMGGSSQCPALFTKTFPSPPDYPKLCVLDSTVPEIIRAHERNIDITRTLFVISSKTGGTVETLSLYKTFFEHVKAKSSNPPGSHFVAITDPGTGLEAIAQEHKFRRLFLNPPDIGGRESALSYFGLVPAALIGVDIATLLDRAIRMAHSSAGSLSVENNVGASLGGALGALQKAGRDKLTFIVSPAIGAFGLWVEQLIAESTGKEGVGIIPICDEPLVEPKSYSKDRVFAYLKLKGGGDAHQDAAFEAIRKAGFPTIQIAVDDRLDLGEEFMRWEIAAATVGSILKINPFYEPNVQESKDNTNRLLAEFERSRELPASSPIAEKGKLAIYCEGAACAALRNGHDFRGLIRDFLNLARPGDYLATMAYVSPNPTVDREIAAIRRAVVERYAIATTFGYGPRYLHSTGQLHKGGPNKGLFLQITQTHREALPIPSETYDFAQLNQAQYLGDFQSLEAHGRRVIRVHLAGHDPIGALETLRHEIVEAIAK
jgi:glucose-6-phosphate isomerase